MKFISKTIKLLPFLFVVFAFNACSDDDDDTPPIVSDPDIVDIAASNAELTTLVTALELAEGDLDELLRDSGPFTVLAPTNQAFDNFLNGTAITDVPSDELAQLLLNHVISADLNAADLSAASSPYASTNADGAGGENLSIYFDTSNGVRFNDVSSVIDGGADIDASNGTIHIVDAVITLPNIVDHATANDGLTDLVGALTAGGNTAFTDLLSNEMMEFTVFAPDNDAFAAYTVDPNTVENVLSNHVIVGATAISTGLSSSYQETAATNADDDALSLYIDVDSTDDVVLNGISTVTTADIVATNGVIHVVDEVIELPTVVTHAAANPAFSTLVTALTDLTPNTDYVGILSANDADNDDSPFTVFAPTNDAFGDLLTDLGLSSATEIDTATLNATLQLHVITDSNVRAEDLASLDGQSVGTFGGGNITIDANTPAIIDPDGGSNPIIVTDVQAVNGVVHAVSRVIRDLPE